MASVAGIKTWSGKTQAEIDACLAELDVTKDQVVRWRREGLLARVSDRPRMLIAVASFSIPAARVRRSRLATRALFEEKNRVAFVGLRLWRQGFPVDEKFWRSRLKHAGRVADKVARLLPGFVDRL